MGLYARRASKSRNIYQSLFLLFLLALCIFILFNSPYFEVKEINVQGNCQLSRQEIIHFSALRTGTNIFKISTKKTASNLKVISFIKKVEVKRDLPASVLIKIEERKPAALLKGSSGFIQIDREKTYLQRIKKLDNNLPLITGIDNSFNGPGETVTGKGLAAALQVVEDLPSGLVTCLSEIHYESGGSFTLYTLRGIQCDIGIPDKINKKGDLFLKVINKVQNQNKEIIYADLSSVDSPVIKYKK
ncbi:MAG: FtsQ-type POTRA domain-containing protein [Clostridiales bacterium]|nr:FtsQ-type POTRA domain-containing protein [Clostridiales bacterium]MCF8021357.1 FtsQ-type POTRA domain-containing protein [Clostridiales bacterium]